MEPYAIRCVGIVREGELSYWHNLEWPCWESGTLVRAYATDLLCSCSDMESALSVESIFACCSGLISCFDCTGYMDPYNRTKNRLVRVALPGDGIVLRDCGEC